MQKKNIREILTNLSRISHSGQGAVLSQWEGIEADPECRLRLVETAASPQCGAQVAGSGPPLGPGRPQRDPTSCCWTLGGPETHSVHKASNRIIKPLESKGTDQICWSYVPLSLIAMSYL